MKKSIAWSLVFGGLLSLLARSAQADEIDIYGAVDVSLMYASQNKQLVLQSGGTNNTYLGLRGSKKLDQLDWLEPGFIFEAALAVDTGTGTSSNLNNASDTAGPTCTVEGAPGAACTVSNGAAQGLVFQRETRLRLLLGPGDAPAAQHTAGERDQLSFGRYYVPALLNLSIFSRSFGLFGLGSPLTLASTNQGATAVRASNSLNFMSRSLRGWSFAAMAALGERSHWKEGDLLGGRVGFDGDIVHLGAAFQYTKHVAGDVAVGNLGASRKLGPVNLAVIGQYSRLDTAVPWSGLYGQLQGDVGLTAVDTLQLGVAWLAVQHSPSDSGQFTLGYSRKLSNQGTLIYTKSSYVLNRGDSVNRTPGTAVPRAGQDAVAMNVGFLQTF